MDGFWTLLFLSTIMGGASFLAGVLPLSFSLPPRHLRIITALGTGVLVGTSLIVIIPEGVDTLYKATGASHSHEIRTLSISQRSILPPKALLKAHHDDHWKRFANLEVPDDLNGGLRSGPDDGFSAVHSDYTTSNSAEDDGAHTEPNAVPDREPHAWIGISLICGFILMYLIDKVPRYASKRTQPQRFPVSLNQFSFNNSRSPSTEESPTPQDDATATSLDSNSSSPSSTTVGLVIHAAADGIALGASSTSSNLSLVIFIALLIHKAPAAFGLTTVLLKQGLSTREARFHLVIFSLAAPIGALLTWSAIHIFGLSSATLGDDDANREFTVGCILLFSGGTFLYVAMHTMQESGSHSQSHGETHDMEYAGIPGDDPYSVNVPVSSHPQTPALVDTLVTVGGMLLPLLTQIGHSH